MSVHKSASKLKITPSASGISEGIREEELDYVRYIQAVYADKVMERKINKTKSANKVQVAELSKQLELKRELLQKTNKRLRDITFYLKVKNFSQIMINNFGDIVETPYENFQESISELVQTLKNIIDIIPTKNLDVPQTVSEVVKLHEVIEDTLAVLEEIHNTTGEHEEIYSQIAEHLKSILSAKETISLCMKECEKLTHCVNSNVLLKSALMCK